MSGPIHWYCRDNLVWPVVLTLLTFIKLTDEQETKQDEVLCKLGCDLDGRFSSVRTAETNLGNLLSDIMLAALQADCAILNAGTVRSNVKHPKGEFKLRVSSGSEASTPTQRPYGGLWGEGR